MKLKIPTMLRLHMRILLAQIFAKPSDWFSWPSDLPHPSTVHRTQMPIVSPDFIHAEDKPLLTLSIDHKMNIQMRDCSAFLTLFQFAVAVAPHFKGPYTVVRKLDLFGEDAGLWRDARGNFHMIFHGGKSVRAGSRVVCQWSKRLCYFEIYKYFYNPKVPLGQGVIIAQSGIFAEEILVQLINSCCDHSLQTNIWHLCTCPALTPSTTTTLIILISNFQIFKIPKF